MPPQAIVHTSEHNNYPPRQLLQSVSLNGGVTFHDEMDIDTPSIDDDRMEVDIQETRPEGGNPIDDEVDYITRSLRLLAIDNDMVTDVADDGCDHREPLISRSPSIPIVPMHMDVMIVPDLESSFDVKPLKDSGSNAPPPGSLDIQMVMPALKNEEPSSILLNNCSPSRRRINEGQPYSDQIEVPFKFETTVKSKPPRFADVRLLPLNHLPPRPTSAQTLRWSDKRTGSLQKTIPFDFPFPKPRRRVSFPLEVAQTSDRSPSPDAQHLTPPTRVDMPLPREEKETDVLEEEDRVLPGAYPTHGVEYIKDLNSHSYLFGALGIFVSVVCGVGIWMVKT